MNRKGLPCLLFLCNACVHLQILFKPVIVLFPTLKMIPVTHNWEADSFDCNEQISISIHPMDGGRMQFGHASRF